MSQVIARRYRPQTFAEVIGQDATVQTITNALNSGRVAHAFIFSGHRGIGKTTVARILAKAMNCRAGERPTAAPCGVCDSCREIRDGNAVDVIEIDAASNRGIDEIRTLRENVRYRPARDRFKFYILDEAHQLTGDAFNALLKTLEEPPEWAVFVLATTEPEALPATIRSRCQHFAFRAVPFALIVARLEQICRQEGIAAEEEALGLIAEAGEGSLRDALSLLDQAISYGGGTLEAETVRRLLGRVSLSQLLGVFRAVADGSAREVLEQTAALLAAGVSPAQLCRQCVSFVRNALVAQAAGSDSALLDLTDRQRAIIGEAAGLWREEEWARALHILLRTAADLRHGQQERLHLELGLLKLVHARRLLGVEELLQRLQSRPEAPAVALPATPPRPASVLTAGSAAAQPAPAPPAADTPRTAERPPALSFGRSPLMDLTTPEKKKTEVAAHGSEIAQTAAGASPAAASLDGGIAAAAPAPPAPGAAGAENAELTQRVLAWLEAQKKGALMMVVARAEWRWAATSVTLVFGGETAALAGLAENDDARKGLREACRQVLGRLLEIQIVRQAASISTPAPRRVADPGAAAERAGRHPLLQLLSDKISVQVLRTLDLNEKE